jgi:hypothetical protein
MEPGRPDHYRRIGHAVSSFDSRCGPKIEPDAMAFAQQAALSRSFVVFP